MGGQPPRRSETGSQGAERARSRSDPEPGRAVASPPARALVRRGEPASRRAALPRPARRRRRRRSGVEAAAGERPDRGARASPVGHRWIDHRDAVWTRRCGDAADSGRPGGLAGMRPSGERREDRGQSLPSAGRPGGPRRRHHPGRPRWLNGAWSSGRPRAARTEPRSIGCTERAAAVSAPRPEPRRGRATPPSSRVGPVPTFRDRWRGSRRTRARPWRSAAPAHLARVAAGRAAVLRAARRSAAPRA